MTHRTKRQKPDVPTTPLERPEWQQVGGSADLRFPHVSSAPQGAVAVPRTTLSGRPLGSQHPQVPSTARAAIPPVAEAEQQR